MDDEQLQEMFYVSDASSSSSEEGEDPDSDSDVSVISDGVFRVRSM